MISYQVVEIKNNFVTTARGNRRSYTVYIPQDVFFSGSAVSTETDDKEFAEFTAQQMSKKNKKFIVREVIR